MGGVGVVEETIKSRKFYSLFRWPVGAAAVGSSAGEAGAGAEVVGSVPSSAMSSSFFFFSKSESIRNFEEVWSEEVLPGQALESE